MRPNLVEHGIDESVLDRDPLANPWLPVVNLNRCPYRLLRRLSVEILDVQVITVDVGDPSLEQVAKARVRILADRDQEVGRNVRPVDAAGQLISETLAGRLAQTIQKVL